MLPCGRACFLNPVNCIVFCCTNLRRRVGGRPASTNENLLSRESNSHQAIHYGVPCIILSFGFSLCTLGVAYLALPHAYASTRRKFALGNWHRGASESKDITGDMNATTNLSSVTPKECEVGALPTPKDCISKFAVDVPCCVDFFSRMTDVAHETKSFRL